MISKHTGISLCGSFLSDCNILYFLVKLVGKNLWNYLEDSTPAYHSRTVELLYQLQQLSPDPWTCEDVISSALLSDNKATYISMPISFAQFVQFIHSFIHGSIHGSIHPECYDQMKQISFAGEVDGW